MRGLETGLSAVVGLTAAFVMSGCSNQAGVVRNGGPGSPSVSSPNDPTYVEWPLPAADQAYGAIDGKHIWQYVVEQGAISRHYRDQGHPQFWGRIIGTSGDAEDAQWLLNKYQQIGMTDTHIQPIDLTLPQWIAQSWEITRTAVGKTTPLTSAQPAYRSPGTEGKELDLEAVYVGLGSEADFAGRDVRGKAALVFDVTHGLASQTGALKRAEEKGAAAIFVVNELPGNMKYQSYPTGTNVPTFSLGVEDGQAVRDLIARAPAGHPPHVNVRMDVKMVPNLKTALVWGTLPGETDETIYVIAHRDGWFESAGDNAGGVASMLGLAEYFAKVPKAQRRRTMVFIGMDGHHNIKPGGFGREWLVAHRAEFFTKTALMINDEHPSDVTVYGTAGELTTATIPLEWYAGGSSRPQLEKIAADAFQEFGVTTWAKPSEKAPGGDLLRFYWFLPAVDAQTNDFLFFHTDEDKPETVPSTGLEAATRAYAKIIDQVNKIDLKDLQLPAAADPNAPGTPQGYR